jgi:hypothetical protein
MNITHHDDDDDDAASAGIPPRVAHEITNLLVPNSTAGKVMVAILVDAFTLI